MEARISGSSQAKGTESAKKPKTSDIFGKAPRENQVSIQPSGRAESPDNMKDSRAEAVKTTASVVPGAPIILSENFRFRLTIQRTICYDPDLNDFDFCQ